MHVDAGDTAWVLGSAALVLFMTPGLALFYGGMVRSKHVLAMMVQNLGTIAVVSVVWAVLAYSLAFGPDAGGGFIGTLHLAGLAHPTAQVPGFNLTVPPLAEQHRIVSELSVQLPQLEAAIASLRRAKINLKRCRAAVLKAA